MKLFKILCVIGLAIALTGIAYAETQSVKISGDLTVRGVARDNYTLDRNRATTNTRTGGQDNWQTYGMSTAEVQIDADLTDNVAAVLRLYNQRDWQVRCKSITATTTTLASGLTDSGYTADSDEFSVGLGLAYIELKEFLYSPLSLKIGRQDLWFGKGFVVGVGVNRDPNSNINADEYSCSNAFDAVRATLDYDPWTIDAVYAKIWENAIDSKDDEDLIGLNIGYIFDVYNAEAELYWFNKRDGSKETMNVKIGNVVHTMGLRGSADPIENLTLAAEAAWQLGTYVSSRVQPERRYRNAWAIDVSAESRYFQEMYAWLPKLGLEYIYYSGHKNIKDETVYSSGLYTGWDRMYRGKFDSAIRDYQGIYYATGMDSNNVRTDMWPNYPDAADSNQHTIIVAGSIQPTDSLTIDCRYFNFWQQYATYWFDTAKHGSARADTYREKANRYLGGEIDVEVTWDYTEDVSFGLLAAWFMPGAHYDKCNTPSSDSVAADIVGSVKVSF